MARLKLKLRAPLLVRQFLAECLGTFFLVLIGDASILQMQLFNKNPNLPYEGFSAVAWGYGLALMVGILVSGGISGGHLNPAVTLGMAALGKCKPIQIPVYMVAQYLGAFLAAAVLFGVGSNMMQHGTLAGGKEDFIGAFATYPSLSNEAGLKIETLIFDQILATMVLMIIILAVTDSKNMNVPSGLVPLLIGLGLSAIHFSLVFNAGAAVNPARDLSPRIVTLIAFGAESTFESFDYFFWIPWILPHVGALVGSAVYYFFIEAYHLKDED